MGVFVFFSLSVRRQCDRWAGEIVHTSTQRLRPGTYDRKGGPDSSAIVLFVRIFHRSFSLSLSNATAHIERKCVRVYCVLLIRHGSTCRKTVYLIYAVSPATSQVSRPLGNAGHITHLLGARDCFLLQPPPHPEFIAPISIPTSNLENASDMIYASPEFGLNRII